MSIEELDKLAMDKSRGCWELLVEVLKVLKRMCDSESLRSADLNTISAKVLNVNPSMAALRNLAKKLSSSEDPCNIVNSWLNKVFSMRSRVVENAKKFIEGRIVTTISRSSAVKDSILSAKPRKVYILESRPGEEAVQLYKELLSKGIPAELVPDTCMARAVELSDAVVVGADAFTIDGWVLNKVGTRALAIVSKYFGKPFIVVCESVKLYEGLCRELEIQRMWSYRIADFINVRVRVFECVEPNLVTFLVTDEGVTRPSRECLELLLSKVTI